MERQESWRMRRWRWSAWPSPGQIRKRLGPGKMRRRLRLDQMRVRQMLDLVRGRQRQQQQRKMRSEVKAVDKGRNG